PRVWRGSATLTSSSNELPAGPLRQLRATVALDQTRIAVTDLRVDALGVPARATADWAWAGGGGVKATLGPASMAGLATEKSSVRGAARATIEARIRSLSDLNGVAHAELDEFAVGQVSLGRGQIDVSARDGAVSAEIAFPEPRLRVQASG